MTELGSLKPGDRYAEGKYKVLHKDDDKIQVVRLSDNWRLEFFNTHPSWRHKVKIDI